MKKLYILILGVFFLSIQVNAQWVQLNHSLMQGASLRQLMKTSNGVFAITTGGLFKTTDKGQNWNYLNNGIDSASNSYRDVAMFNNNIYVQKSNSRNLLKYNNSTWTELNSNGFPMDGNSWGLGAANNKLFTFYYDYNNNKNYIYYSNDGSTWTQGVYLGSNQGGGGNNSLLNLNNLKQFISFNDSLFFTIDGLTKTPIPYPNGMDANQFSDANISAEPNGDYIYINDKQNKSFRMNINSFPLQWEDISANITTNVNAFVPELAVSDGVIFANVMISLGGMKFLRSVDHGMTFDSINIVDCGLDIPLLNEIITESSGNLIAQDMSNHLFYSSDNGNTWTKRDNGLLAIPSGNLVNKNGVLYNCAATDGGANNIVKSADKGITWTKFNEGLPEFGKPLFNESLIFIQALFKVNITPYVIADDMTEFNQLPFVYRLDSINNKWVKTTAQPGTNAKRIKYLGNNKNTFFVSLETNNSTSLMRSPDGGQNWNDITSALSGFNFQEIYSLTGKGETDTLLLFGRNNNGNELILYSINNGSNWSNLYSVNNGQIQRADDNNNSVAVCDFGGTNKTFIIVLKEWGMYGETGRLYALKNGNMEMLNTSGLPSNLHANCIKYIGGHWYLGTTIGIYVSDNGKIWSHINNTNYYPGMNTQQIHIIGQDIFIGTNTGIWKKDLNAGINIITKNDNEIKIYPNPVNDILNIDFKDNNQKSIVIYSVVGEKIYSEITYNNIQIDFKGFSKGLYLLQIRSGEKSYTRKIVK